MNECRRPASAAGTKENPAKMKLLTSQLSKSNLEKNRMAAEIKALKEDLQKSMEKQRPRVRSPPVRSQSLHVFTELCSIQNVPDACCCQLRA